MILTPEGIERGIRMLDQKKYGPIEDQAWALGEGWHNLAVYTKFDPNSLPRNFLRDRWVEFEESLLTLGGEEINDHLKVFTDGLGVLDSCPSSPLIRRIKLVEVLGKDVIPALQIERQLTPGATVLAAALVDLNRSDPSELFDFGGRIVRAYKNGGTKNSRITTGNVINAKAERLIEDGGLLASAQRSSVLVAFRF